MQDGSSAPPSTDTPTATPTEIQRPPKASIFSGFLSLITALAVVLAVRSMVFEPFKIPSGSMMPTLLKGDHIFVKKFAYSIRVPFSDFFGPGKSLMEISRPERGDIIVFRYPKDETTHFIKRVVGLPGDTVQITDKVVSINGVEVTQDKIAAETVTKLTEDFDDVRYRSPSMGFYTEHLGTVNHPIIIDRGNYLADSYGPVTVPADHVFVMGDNRDYSNDSRFWGFVPLKNVTGKAMFIWMSFFYDRADGSMGFHPNRIGTSLR